MPSLLHAVTDTVTVHLTTGAQVSLPAYYMGAYQLIMVKRLTGPLHSSGMFLFRPPSQLRMVERWTPPFDKALRPPLSLL